MYSQDKIDIALQVYHQCGSATLPPKSKWMQSTVALSLEKV